MRRAIFKPATSCASMGHLTLQLWLLGDHAYLSRFWARALVFEDRHNVCDHFLLAVEALRLIATERIVKHFQQAAVAVGARTFCLVAAFREHVWKVRVCEQGSPHRHTVEGSILDRVSYQFSRLKATGAQDWYRNRSLDHLGVFSVEAFNALGNDLTVLQEIPLTLLPKPKKQLGQIAEQQIVQQCTVAAGQDRTIGALCRFDRKRSGWVSRMRKDAAGRHVDRVRSRRLGPLGDLRAQRISPFAPSEDCVVPFDGAELHHQEQPVANLVADGRITSSRNSARPFREPP